MKGLNVKRIAALAAGAAILGATLAYAAGGVYYGNTQIISADGSPQVKVVVGAGAAASDGVAAANIAAVIGNLAFKSGPISTTINGLDAIGCTTSGGGGAGTCAVSNEKVTLSVTLPGTVSGIYQFNTYINDWVDKKLENRERSTADDVYNTTIDLSPFSPLTTGSGINYAVRKITANDFPALQSPSVTDPYANKQYTEQQTLWFQALAQYDTIDKKLAAVSPRGAYQIEFTQDDSGLPAGTCDATTLANLDSTYQTNTNNTGNYNYCPDSDKTDRHRVHLGFLGDTYIVSQMSPPTTCSLTSSLSQCNGGSIALAKESAYGIVHVGENLSAGAYTIKLADIEAPLGGGQSQQSGASVAIYDSTGTLLHEDKYYPSTNSYTWTAPDGSKIRIRVYKTNPGYYAYAKWAEMAVYSQEFTLTDGQYINSDNKNWYVTLVWRNKDPTYADKNADSLRKIILYDNYANPLTVLGTGDTYNYIQSPAAYMVEFGGLTLGSADYDSLTLAIAHYTSPQFPVQTNFTSDCSATSTILNTEGDLLQVQSLVKDAFQLSAGGGTYTAQTFFYFLGNATSTGSTIGLSEGDIIFQKPGGSCYYNATGATVYYMAGDATSDDWGVTYVKSTVNGVGWNASVILTESASALSGIRDNWNFTIYNDSDGSRKFLLSSTATAQGRYTGTTHAMGTDSDFVITPNSLVDPYYYSERGSQFAGISTTAVSLNRARRLGELQFYVKSQGTNVSTGTTVGPLGEGESANVGGGVTITVNTITETVGTCTAGPNAVCTVTGKDGVTATANPATADSRVPIRPVGTNKLVVLDSDAAGLSSTLITVGGPVVNTVTKDALANSSLTLVNPGDIIWQEVGTNKIVVAGYSAADTTTAAEDFINKLLGS